MEGENLETNQELSIDTWTNNITDNQIISYWLKIWAGILVFILFVVISKIITKIIKRNIRKHLEETNPTWAAKIAKLLGSILFRVLMLFALFISFEIMWVNIWLLVSWVSLWVWLAFKEVLWNMFAWIMILYTKEFKMWDIIEIQTGEWYFWRIEEITIRYTVIRTLDLRQVIIPNMTMISEPIKTFSSEDLVKLNTVVWISYKTDLTKAIEVLKDTINSFDFVKSKENTTAYVLNFGESTIDLKCVFCFDPNCGIIGEVAIWQVNESIPKAFKENGINFSYPHITVNFENQPNNEKYEEFIANESKNNVEQSAPTKSRVLDEIGKIPQGGEELKINNEKLGWDQVEENVSEPTNTQAIYQNEDYDKPNYNEEYLNDDISKKEDIEHNNIGTVSEVTDEGKSVNNQDNSDNYDGINNWSNTQNDNFTNN